MGDKLKYHLVNWQQICTPLRNGGLGIRNLSIFNKALLGKWLWRYGADHEALWRRVVDSKYGSHWRGWCSHKVHVPYGVGLWKFIRASWDDFSRHSAFQVGDGAQVKFWLDTWCGDQPLQDTFPNLFRLARVLDVSVADHLQILGTSHHWDVVFSRQAQDWELEIVSAFMELLYSCPIRRGSLDEMCWRLSSQKAFTVRSYYSCLLQPSGSFFPWKSVWKSKVPTRVAFFTWTAALERILSVDNLRKRRVIIIDWCYMCKAHGKTVNHLLLHYTVAQELWSLIFALFGIAWVMPRGVVDLLSCWSDRFGKSEAGAIWKAIPHCLM